MKTLLSCMALIVAVGATDALSAGLRQENTSWEQMLKRKAEWDQARDTGGYLDPFSIVVRLVRGEELPDNLIQPVINDPEQYRLYHGSPPPEVREAE